MVLGDWPMVSGSLPHHSLTRTHTESLARQNLYARICHFTALINTFFYSVIFMNKGGEKNVTEEWS